MSKPKDMGAFLIPIELLARICRAFLAMQAQGARCPDETLMEDLDRALARAESLRGGKPLR